MDAADSYLLVKVVHIISATVLFGTGLGTAFFFWSSRHADVATRLFAARTTVRADMLFTLPAVVLQPLTGAWLVIYGGFDWTDSWLVATYGLYLLVGLCWLPVVWIQFRMMRMLEAKAAGLKFDADRFEWLRRTWFALGWPAFGGLVVVFYLMVAKPVW
ncbi:MAG TPA: DUF2269 domain-containing protein [Sphingomicrobium sp.]|nr:DUF2269 domain-containing protein [Sphingomicrobium sp.]